LRHDLDTITETGPIQDVSDWPEPSNKEVLRSAVNALGGKYHFDVDDMIAQFDKIADEIGRYLP
jgi:hypothetical protein